MQRDATEPEDKTFINPEVSGKYNIVRYGVNGMAIHDNAGKTLKVFNESNDDYTNWLESVRWGKENVGQIQRGHEEKMNRIPDEESDPQLTLF